MTGIPDRLGKPLESGGIVDVERHIMKPAQEALGDAVLVEAFREMLAQRLLGSFAKGPVVELGASRAYDPEPVRQEAVGIESIEGREQHPPRKIAGRTEQE
jgi:hypothetical protein